MRCRSCDCSMSDRETNRKYSSWREIKNPEDRYIGLCDGCISDTGLVVVDDPLAADVAELEE